MELSDHARQNRASWDAEAEAYQARNAKAIEHEAPHWGMWQLPESELHALGELDGREVLELGCGAGQFGLSLVRQGARVTGIDNSAKQLEFARANVGDRMTLVHGSAEALPFENASFDLVCCDHGAVGFTDPTRTVPEVARVLRAGGRFVFCGTTPFIFVTWPMVDGPPGRTLERSYFDSRRMLWNEDDPSFEYQMPYGEWIRLFRANGFVIEDLIELRPAPNAETAFTDYVTLEWARDFPAEQIWKVRKEPT